MSRHRRVRFAAVFTAGATLLAITPVVAGAAPANTSAAAVKGPKCFGKKPGYVLTGAHTSLTLTAKNRNAVVDLLGKGETLNAGKAKGNTYVCGHRRCPSHHHRERQRQGQHHQRFPQRQHRRRQRHLHPDRHRQPRRTSRSRKRCRDPRQRQRHPLWRRRQRRAPRRRRHHRKHGRQHLIGGTGNDTLYAGKATATLDGSNPGTHYIVPAAYAPHTTVILRAGDTLNGKPYPTPTPTMTSSTPAPAPPGPAAPPLPTGTIVDFGDADIANVAVVDAPVIFDATGAPSSGGDVTGWAIDFGDGSPATHGVGLPPAQVTHAYVTTGSYLATLSLTDGLGRTVTTSAGVDVAGDSSASFILAEKTQTSLNVFGTFTGAAGARAHIVMSSVDYGDGSDPTMTSGAPGAISHTYPQPGTYTVTVTVNDDHGGYDYTSQTVAITSGRPDPDLTSETNPTGAGTFVAVASQSVALSAATSVAETGDTITSLSINASDGSGTHDITDGGRYSAYYTSSGSYPATLSLKQSDGTTSTESPTIYVASDTGSASVSGPSTRCRWQPGHFQRAGGTEHQAVRVRCASGHPCEPHGQFR